MTKESLIKQYEIELNIIKKSKKSNIENGNNGLAYKREIQFDMLEKVIKDLNKL